MGTFHAELVFIKLWKTATRNGYKSRCPSIVRTVSAVHLVHPRSDPDGEIENSGKSIFEIRIPNFCHIQIIIFDLSYLQVAAVGDLASTLPWKIVKNMFYIFRNFLW